MPREENSNTRGLERGLASSQLHYLEEYWHHLNEDYSPREWGAEAGYVGLGADAGARKNHDLNEGKEEKLPSQVIWHILLAPVTVDHSY